MTFHLSHLPADYDLVVYGPAGAGQARPPVASTPPIDGQPLADTGFATTHATDPLAPQTLNDVTLAQGLPVYGVSTLRGTQDDAVTVISNGEVGNYTVQVSGFNGATSNKPYMLRAETTPRAGRSRRARPARSARRRRRRRSSRLRPARLRATSTRSSSSTTSSSAGSTRTTTPNGASVSRSSTRPRTSPGYANAGFPAAVVHVDANAAVTSAYAAWNACPSDPAKANATTKAIADVLDTRARDVQERRVRRARRRRRRTAVLAARRPDDPLDRERLRRDVPVDDARSADRWRRRRCSPTTRTARPSRCRSSTGSSTCPISSPAGSSRRPANINAQLDAFIAGSTPGHLHPATALTTGYDFLSDGATAVSPALGVAAAGTREQDRDQRHVDEEHADRRRRAAVPVERRRAARHRLAERARRSQPLQARRRHRPVQRLGGSRGHADVRRPARVQHGLPRRPQRLRRVRRRRTTSTGRSSSRRRAPRPTSPTPATATATRPRSRTPRI